MRYPGKLNVRFRLLVSGVIVIPYVLARAVLDIHHILLCIRQMLYTEY